MSEGIPLEQGLRLQAYVYELENNKSEGIPLEQGLRHERF